MMREDSRNGQCCVLSAGMSPCRPSGEWLFHRSVAEGIVTVKTGDTMGTGVSLCM
jgi:hypothetical protein